MRVKKERNNMLRFVGSISDFSKCKLLELI